MIDETILLVHLFVQTAIFARINSQIEWSCSETFLKSYFEIETIPSLFFKSMDIEILDRVGEKSCDCVFFF